MLLQQAWRRTNPRHQDHCRRLVRRWLATAADGSNRDKDEQTLILNPGTRFTATRSFSEGDLERYAALAGDGNPIHTRRSAAEAAGFRGGCVVHGMLTAGLFPAIIGSNFPGAIYVSQTLKFQNPAFAGESLEAQVTVLECVRMKRSLYKATFATSCFKSTAPDTIVVDGTAVALVPG